jgi:hypothetical protein
MTRDTFQVAIDSFLGELAGIVGGMTDAHLMEMPNFVAELDESVTSLQDPRRTRIEIVRIAVGIVDELVHARRDEIMRDAYDFFVARNASAGNDNLQSSDPA